MENEYNGMEPEAAAESENTTGGRKRTVQIKFRVTEAERDMIYEKMRLLHTNNLAAYLRKMSIDGYIIAVDHSDLKALAAQIQKIGVNVNGLAVAVPRVNLFRGLIRRGGENLYTLFAFVHLPLKIVFPSGESCNMGSVGLLHGD